MAETRVTRPMLVDAQNFAVSTGENISRALATTVATIEGEGGASLRGGAGSALQMARQRMDAAQRSLLQALNSMAEAVGASNVQYGSTDADMAQEIARVNTDVPTPFTSALRG